MTRRIPSLTEILHCYKGVESMTMKLRRYLSGVYFSLLILFPASGYSPPANYPYSNYSIRYFALTGRPISLNQNTNYLPENSSALDSVIIPLKRAGRLLLIEATADNESGNLVFDTGANGIVFNSTYFRNHVKSGGSTSNGITGSVGSIDQVTFDKIEFAGLTYRKVRADVTNLGHIENKRGIKILGLIGFSILRNFEIVIDAKNNQLKLYRIDKSGKRIHAEENSFHPDHLQKIPNNSDLLFLEGKIGGRNLLFCFDTGAETNVISSYSNKNVMNTLTITRRSALHGAGSGRSEVLYGKMNDFILGDRQIAGMETIVSNLDALNDAYGTKIDGMLGYNFMEQGILCINFVRKQFSMQFTKGEDL